MRIVFAVIVFLHGLLHTLGLIKALNPTSISSMSSIPKPYGFLWMCAAVLFIVFGVQYFTGSKYAPWVGLIAVLSSEILILTYWKDARFGTLPNVLILVVSVSLVGQQIFRNKIEEETARILSKNGAESKKISERDLSNLPSPVARWLTHCGMVGKASISVGRVVQEAQMQMKQGKGGWMTAKALQYSTLNIPAFIWCVEVNRGGLITFQGRDKFEDGHGLMTIKMNSLVSVVNERGEKLDEAILQTYLGEMVWFPSLALSPYIVWTEIDANTAIATLSYNGTTGSGTFFFNSEGDVVKYSALRYKDNGKEAKRYVWEMNIYDYRDYEGIRVPSRASATWKLDDGNWTWLRLKVTDLKFNEGALAGRKRT